MTEVILPKLTPAPAIEAALEAHRTAKNVLLETFLAPNGLFAGAIPEGVAQHELLKPHFAVDRPISFGEIKAGATGVWFQMRTPQLEHYAGGYQTDDGNDHEVIMPLGTIVSCENIPLPDGKPGKLWKVTLEAPAWKDGEPGFDSEEDREGEALRYLDERAWIAYQRHLWVPLGWGTPEGYPTSSARIRDLVSDRDIVKVVTPSRLMNATRLPSLASRIFEADEDWITTSSEGNSWDNEVFNRLYFVLAPKIDTLNYEGQGDRIPDMPNQQQPQPGGGEAGEGQGEGDPGEPEPDAEPAEEEIPPMPGEPGGDQTGSAHTIEHLKAKGWWGSKTGA